MVHFLKKIIFFIPVYFFFINPIFAEYSPNRDPWIDHAIQVIYSTYGDVVSVDEKDKDLLKFGRNDNVGTGGATVMTLIDAETEEKYVFDNLITTISSESTSDLEPFRMEGHTYSGGDFSFVVVTGTLDGQNQVSLSTPVARSSRLEVTGTINLVGPVYVYENDTDTSGKPDTDTGVHMMLPAGENKSFKAATTTSSVDYWIITSWYCDVLEKTASYADCRLEFRDASTQGVFKSIDTISTSTYHRGVQYYNGPYKIIPKNSDVRIQAVASTSSVSVSAGITGVLAKVIE